MILEVCKFTVILLFLKRERERTVTVTWTDRDRNVNGPWPFSTIRSKELLRYDSKVLGVLDRPLFLTVTMIVPDRYHDRSWPLSWPFLTVPQTVRTGERSGTLNGMQRSYFTRQTVWNVCKITFTFTFQKRKKHYIVFSMISFLKDDDHNWSPNRLIRLVMAYNDQTGNKSLKTLFSETYVFKYKFGSF